MRYLCRPPTRSDDNERTVVAVHTRMIRDSFLFPSSLFVSFFPCSYPLLFRFIPRISLESLTGVKSRSDSRVALTTVGTLIPSEIGQSTNYRVVGLTIVITNLRITLTSPLHPQLLQPLYMLGALSPETGLNDLLITFCSWPIIYISQEGLPKSVGR